MTTSALSALLGAWTGREVLDAGTEIPGRLDVAMSGGALTLRHRQGEAYDGLTVVDADGGRYRHFDNAGVFGEEVGRVSLDGGAVVMTRGDVRARFAVSGDGTLHFNADQVNGGSETPLLRGVYRRASPDA